MSEFTDNLKKARENKGLTQTELAAIMGVTQGTAAKWESGMLQPPLSALPRLAKTLNTTVNDLLGVTGIN